MKLDDLGSMSLGTRATLSSEASGALFLRLVETTVTRAGARARIFRMQRTYPPSVRIHSFARLSKRARRSSQCRFFVTRSEALVAAPSPVEAAVSVSSRALRRERRTSAA